MAAAAGFICELAACLTPQELLHYLLPLASEVLANRSHPQPVLELLSGAGPLRRAARELDPRAAQDLERGLQAACLRLEEGQWPPQSRLYTLQSLRRHLAAGRAAN
jgi:hypothetical protein